MALSCSPHSTTEEQPPSDQVQKTVSPSKAKKKSSQKKHAAPIQKEKSNTASSESGNVDLDVPDNTDKKQEPAPPAGPLQEGIRFVFREHLEHTPEDLFFLLEEDKSVPVIKSRGIPAPRLPFPAGKTVKLYKGDPLNKENPGSLIATGKVPDNMGEKLVGIIIVEKDEMQIQFIDETDFVFGDVILQNLTPEELILKIRLSPEKEESIPLPPDMLKKFSPGANAPGSGKENIYAATLYRKDSKDRWYATRQTSVEVPVYSTDIIFYLWNEKTKLPETHKISLRQER